MDKIEALTLIEKEQKKHHTKAEMDLRLAQHNLRKAEIERYELMKNILENLRKMNENDKLKGDS